MLLLLHLLQVWRQMGLRLEMGRLWLELGRLWLEVHRGLVRDEMLLLGRRHHHLPELGCRDTGARHRHELARHALHLLRWALLELLLWWLMVLWLGRLHFL